MTWVTQSFLGFLWCCLCCSIPLEGPSALTLSLNNSSLLGLGAVLIPVGSVNQLTKQAHKRGVDEGRKRSEGRAGHE